MNSSLLSMYSSPVATLPSSPSASDLVSQGIAQPAAQITDAPAFAPPQVLLFMLLWQGVHLSAICQFMQPWQHSMQLYTTQMQHFVQGYLNTRSCIPFCSTAAFHQHCTVAWHVCDWFTNTVCYSRFCIKKKRISHALASQQDSTGIIVPCLVHPA